MWSGFQQLDTYIKFNHIAPFGKAVSSSHRHRTQLSESVVPAFKQVLNELNVDDA